jgi:hypothetical protein
VRDWIDTAVPALNGLTPRDAARVPPARSKLEILLMNRLIQSTPCGRRAAGAEEGRSTEANSRCGEARARKWPAIRNKAPIRKTISCGSGSASPRSTFCHNQASTGTARALGSEAPYCSRAFGGSAQSRTHKRTSRSRFRGTESSAHTGSSRLRFEGPRARERQPLDSESDSEPPIIRVPW